MSATTFFEKMIGLQQQRSQQKQSSYRELVASIATGEEPSAAEVDRLLAETKKSISDLKHDVETYQHRMALKAIVASLPKLEQEFAQVQQQIAAADRDLEAAERKHDEITGPLFGRLHEIKEARKDASAASQELYETCDSPDLEQQVAEINAEIERLNKSAWDLAIQAAYLDNKAEAERHQADKELTEADRDHRREQAALFEKQAESLRQRVKSSQKDQADAVKRREQIEECMRQW
jgi:chromosome segregation ATPase